jgi:hypothetical protein
MTKESTVVPESEPLFTLFLQEGHLLRSCLTSGLTALRSASPERKDQCYCAFFQLSMGLERLLKLILILNYMAEHNGKVPNREWLRSCGGKTGHDIAILMEHVWSHKSESAAPLQETMNPGTLALEVINFLTGFGNGARYYNLDALCAGTRQIDPLSSWDRIIQRIVVENVSEMHKDLIRRSSGALAGAVEDFTLARGFDMERRPVSFEQRMRLDGLYTCATPYAVLQVMNILFQLKALLDEARTRAGSDFVPFLGEFLDFVTNDRRLVLRKKRWP